MVITMTTTTIIFTTAMAAYHHSHNHHHHLTIIRALTTSLLSPYYRLSSSSPPSSSSPSLYHACILWMLRNIFFIRNEQDVVIHRDPFNKHLSVKNMARWKKYLSSWSTLCCLFLPNSLGTAKEDVGTRYPHAFCCIHYLSSGVMMPNDITRFYPINQK